METPVEIDFQGMPAQPSIRDAIAKHIDELERRFGRITAGRVVVKATWYASPYRTLRDQHPAGSSGWS